MPFESESGLTGAAQMADKDLVLYSGLLVSFQVQRQCDIATLENAIAKIRRDIERSLERHLPSGCAADLQRMA
jgi:hypothetical protein